jgi:hypothetical protein
MVIWCGLPRQAPVACEVGWSGVEYAWFGEPGQFRLRHGVRRGTTWDRILLRLEVSIGLEVVSLALTSYAGVVG